MVVGRLGEGGEASLPPSPTTPPTFISTTGKSSLIGYWGYNYFKQYYFYKEGVKVKFMIQYRPLTYNYNVGFKIHDGW